MGPHPPKSRVWPGHLHLPTYTLLSLTSSALRYWFKLSYLGVSKTEFDNCIKANDAVLRNMQNQGQTLQNHMTNLTDMLSKFMTSNTASTSGSGTLPGNTVTNPKEDLKGITTRSGVAYQGPTSSSSPRVMNRDTEVTKDTMLPTNNRSTEDVQPPVVQVQSQNPISEPDVAPVRASMPNLGRTSISHVLSRRNDERRRGKKLTIKS
ncbi:hypothetical protein Tco_1183510 [Tanacetum coccineum]